MNIAHLNLPIVSGGNPVTVPISQMETSSSETLVQGKMGTWVVGLPGLCVLWLLWKSYPRLPPPPVNKEDYSSCCKTLSC